MNHTTVNAVIFCLLSLNTFTVCIEFIVKPILSLDNELICNNCIAFNQITFNGYTNQFSSNCLVSDNKVSDNTRCGVKLLDCSFPDVREINICKFGIKIFNRRVR
ncbi:hypothetical protein DXD92_03420 [Blautia sp. TM10-2]|nr:hypothetical protein DXD92_03420 [Blautia sp. TM10-2]